MKTCAKSFMDYKLVVNIIIISFGYLILEKVTYNQVWLGWFVNLLLCVYATYNCQHRLDPIPLLLAMTVNAKNPSNMWLMAYTLYIMYFTSSIGIPIIGAIGVILPLLLMKDNSQFPPYRIFAVILTAVYIKLLSP